MTTDISKPHKAYMEMAEDWLLPETLVGGTSAMREAGRTFLPQEPRESGAAYRVRLNRSFLFNGYGATLRMLSAKPFKKEITEIGDVSDIYRLILDDVDLCGSNITRFSRGVFEDGMQHGLTHILIDMPSRDTGENIDLASQREANIRPYFVSISARSLINWTSTVLNGRVVLTSATIKTQEWVNKGNTQELMFVYTVYYEDVIEKYTAQTEKETPQLVSTVVNTLGIVPIVTFYSNKTGFMTGKPPMMDLAYTNLNHWQSYSDQRNILRIARVPFLLATGFSSEGDINDKGEVIAGTSELETVMTISPNSLAASANEKANLRYVEHSGAGIEAGEKDLANLKLEMAVQGATFIIPKEGKMTATEFKGNSGSIQSELQAMTVNFQDALNHAMVIASKWLNLPEPEFNLEVYKDFNASLDDASHELLLKLRQAGQITQQTLLNELKRRGVLSDSFDVEFEVDETQQEDTMLEPFMPTVNNG